MFFLRIFMFPGDSRELGASDEDSPDKRNQTHNQVGHHHAHRLMCEVGIIGMSDAHGVHLLRREFDAREDKHRAQQYPGYRAQRIEGLREIKPAGGAPGTPVAERVRRRLQKRKSARDHENSANKKKP